MLGRRRLINKLNTILKEEYALGRVPPSDVVARKMHDFADMDLEAPFFTPPDVSRRTRFDVDGFNAGTSAIHDDLSTLYEEDVNITTNLIAQVSLQDGVYKSQLAALHASSSQLGDLLLTNNHGGAALLSVFDDFTDLSKVDRLNTTAFVDLSMRTVSLPPNKAATKRIQLPHLIGKAVFDTTITRPPEDHIVHQHQIPGSNAGAVADDTTSAWQYQVFTRGNDEGVTVEAVVDLSASGRDVSFSRFDFEALSPSATKVRVLVTRDYANWLTLPGYTDPIIVDTTPVTMRFPMMRAKAIKLVLSKDAPDGMDKVMAYAAPTPKSNEYPYYHFGIRNIALYEAGYPSQAVLRSTTLLPQSTGIPVSKAALYVSEHLPQGTDIKYELGQPSADPEWSDIAPMHRDVEGAPKIVNFGGVHDSPRADNHIIAPTGIVGTTGIDGTTFYNIYNTEYEAIPSSGRLWRGKNAWTRSVNEVRKRETMVGCQVYFTKTDRFQQLYLTAQDEEPVAITPPTGVDDPDDPYDMDTKLELKHIVLTDPEGSFALTPSRAAAGPDIPAYSVEKVIHASSDSQGADSGMLWTGASVKVSYDDVKGGGERIVRLEVPDADAVAGGTIVPSIYMEYTAGTQHISKHFLIKDDVKWKAPTEDVTVFFIEDPDQVLRSSDSVNWAIPTKDITHFVTKIEQNQIYISHLYPYIVPGERVLVTYRHILDGDYELIPESLVMKSTPEPKRMSYKSFTSPTMGMASTYTLGKDYSVDVRTRSVRHLQSGGIPIHDVQPTVLSVDFDYWQAVAGKHVYSSFFILEEPLDRLQLAQLNLNPDAGEKLLLVAGGKHIDITRTNEATDLPAGAVQVIVYSSDLLRITGVLDRFSVIYRVMNATDTEGHFVFARGNKYWQRQVAMIEPMKQVSFLDLTRSVSKDDRRFFAIHGSALWINYDPYSSTDLVALDWAYPDPSPLPSSDVPELAETPEFELLYKYIADTSAEPGILIRATLMRNENTEGDVTPLLGNYSIRFV